jgi:RHS repeat-associated protein
MLREAIRPDGEAVSFSYDALARRVSKTFRGQTTRFAWDGDVPVHEWVEGLGAPGTASATTWLFEPETFTPMAKGDGDGWKSIVTDHVGAPSALYDEGGAQVWSATLDVYGDVRRLDGRREDCPFRWPGQYEDGETGLYYNRFRAYDPDVGQYLSPDPLRTWRCFEAYLYVEDPLAAIDPLGLQAEPVTHMIRVQIQRGTVNLSSVAVERTRAVTAVEVEQAMLQAIRDLPSGERDLIPAAHGTAAQLSKKLRGIVGAGGTSDGGNILRGWLRGADRVRFDIENRGTNLLSCE